MKTNEINREGLLAKRQLPDLIEARKSMIARLSKEQLFAKPVLEVMGEVPRHAFSPPQFWRIAYNEMEIWGPGGYLTKPSIIAKIASEVFKRAASRVLIYGAWAGYEAVVLSVICDRVDTVEHDPWLLWSASDAYRELGINNVHQKASDGRLGWPERRPFDVIIFGAAIPFVPNVVWSQLANGGAVIAPIGNFNGPHRLLVGEKLGSSIQDLGPCLYPPLSGVWGA